MAVHHPEFPGIDERKLLAKTDFRVLPTITVIYVLAFLDRYGA
jgi:hypothetical protein